MSVTANLLDQFLTLRRTYGVHIGPDGELLVLSARQSADDRAFQLELWSMPSDGETGRRLLAEPATAQLATGATAIFYSQSNAGRTEIVRLSGGARTIVCGIEGKVGALRVQPGTDTLVIGVWAPPNGVPAYGAAAWQSATAVVYRSWPIRHWDEFHQPAEARFVMVATDGTTRLLIPEADVAADDFDVAADGSVIALGRDATAEPVAYHNAVFRIDPHTAAAELLTAGDESTLFREVRCAPGGQRVAFVAADLGTPARPMSEALWALDAATSQMTRLTEAGTPWPRSIAWTPDGGRVLFVGDDHGHAPVFLVDVTSGQLDRITDDGAFTTPAMSADGTVYAVYSTVCTPPRPVRLSAARTPVPVAGWPCDAYAEDQVVQERLLVDSDDGVRLGAWLVAPRHSNGALPMLVVLHGGPFVSWTEWTWRCNAALLAAIGYVVLLPDPALSTGYGPDFIGRAWGSWGTRHHRDITAIVDSIAGRPEIDTKRLGIFGASFGGYLVNWMIGHDTRFRAAVSHAGIWSLPGYQATSDAGHEPERQFGPSGSTGYTECSPDRFAARITTPVLLVHGARDYRVPEGQTLEMYRALRQHGTPVRLLYFTDEGHWISKPDNIRTWYTTLIAFFDQQLRDGPALELALACHSRERASEAREPAWK